MGIPYFSVIIPFYNKEKSIARCLNSITNQDFPISKYEVICINNNSTDNSLKIVASYPSIRLIHEKQQGAYAARNTGILNSNASILVFTDADTEVKNNWLSNIYSILNKNNYDILIGWYMPANSIKLLEIHSMLVYERIEQAIKKKNSSLITACGANLIIRKEIFNKEGLFLADSNSEDLYFIIRCLEKYNIGFDRKITVKRNDIDSIKIALLKNLIYGFSNARDIKHKTPLSGKLLSILFTGKFILKYFPTGLALLLFPLSYLSGYLIEKLIIMDNKNFLELIHSYTKLINKKAI